ncbi:MAG: LPS assembly lipoprotein LptE, partial [Candidatus Omnitrophota bacterium]|nr:LPS assembly lipoprotein LptE [Candidatus Omnitrophota bacterium]
ENADLILKGELMDYRQEALRYDTSDNVEEYRIKIAVNIELIDTSDDEVLWKEAGYIGEETYKTAGRFAVSEDTAREEAIKDLARRIVERTVENW